MKKVLIAALCCGMFTLGSVDSVEAADKPISTDIKQASAVEIQEVDFWSHEMRKIFGRRRNRGDDSDDIHRPPPPPPPPGYRNGYRHPPGPPPGHYPPPPPPRRPPGPPPRHHSVQDVAITQLMADKAVE